MRIGTRTGKDISSFKKELISMKKGDQVSITGPFGWFKIQDNSTPIVMVAGGVGITPFRALLKQLEKDASRVIDIIYSSSDYYLYEDEINAIASENDKITLHKTSDRKATSEALVTLAEKHSGNAYYYVSGSPPFIKSINYQIEVEVIVMKKYMEWVKDNWQKSAILVLIYVMASILPLYNRVDLMEFMILLAFPLYLVHEIEEYILPGGFSAFFNKNLLKIDTKEKILPIDREVIFWINLVYIWIIIPVFAGLAFYNMKLAIWIPYFLFFQALSHLAMGIKGKMIINPGIRSSFLLHVPYAIILIRLFLEKGLITNPYFNVYAMIGFMFNLLLPIIAGFLVMPRYRKRVGKE